MKTALIALALTCTTVSASFAQSVNGYFKSNGTYVSPHYRSNPNGTVTDNYSFKGNSNPYTGNSGSNRYRSDTTSPYFNGTPSSNGRYGHSSNRW
ncbi:hypothetical protein G6L16_000830 [Agrobacterium tumefaciens]|uniref:hypothetical protein n=1 Tax=Agrobacterium tumefaciens TaxID=358 RepID=UPI001573E96B|nr:hypothetical protein [Agrobacterium tumefaciens]WIE38086.1 hypothetical protein G6L16_000830 [Agrobacterium tumefaciens]